MTRTITETAHDLLEIKRKIADLSNDANTILLRCTQSQANVPTFPLYDQAYFDWVTPIRNAVEAMELTILDLYTEAMLARIEATAKNS